MPFGDALENMRKTDYGAPPKKEESKGESSRMLHLTEEETKSLAPYQEGGEEIVLEVTGKLEGDHFHVMSAKYAPKKEGEEEPNDAAQVAGLQGPLVGGSVPMY